MSEKPVKRSYDATSWREAAAATRERICIAAEELFLRDGYARTSVRAVAKAAGVAEATVYLAFAGKAALLDAVIVRAVRDNASEPLVATPAPPPGSRASRSPPPGRATSSAGSPPRTPCSWVGPVG